MGDAEKPADPRTFRILDGDLPLPPPTSALDEWYLAVRDLPLSELSVADLSRACRQQLFCSELVPICLWVLGQDPLAGELYDGELIYALQAVPGAYWRTHPQERRQFLAAAERAHQESGDARPRRFAEALPRE